MRSTRLMSVLGPTLWAALAGSAAAGTYEAPLDVRKDVRAKITARPKTKRSRDGVSISFAVSAKTDVEVAILDSRGRVVRHLAAGLLGKNAPAPFRKNSLRQEIVWDRRDDVGKPVKGGLFKARVRVGAKPRLEKHLGWDGNTFGGTIAGLAVGERSEVYVLLANGWYGRAAVRVLDKNGKYLRTIMPYPAETPKERTASVGHLEVEGERLPMVFNGHSGNVYPLTSGMRKQTMVFSPKGCLLMVSGLGTMAEHGPPRHLLALDPEGGAPRGWSFVGPRIRKARGFMGGAGEGGSRCFGALAASPDGQWVYFTQVIYRRGFKQRHGVFRLKWTDKEPGEPFLGKTEPGGDDEHFNDPQGIATDSKGNIFVCDRGNNRVMVFSGAGKLLGKFAVERPQQIAVHPKSGEMYVLSRGMDAKRRERWAKQSKLLKFSAWGRGEPRELSRLEQGGVIDVIALDAASSPPKLWAALGRSNLAPITDRGGQLQLGGPVNNRNGLEYPMFIAADPARNRVLLRRRAGGKRGLVQIELTTGKITPLPVRGSDVALDRDGNIYVMDGYGTNSMSRYDPSGKPLPFSGTGTNKIKANYRGYGPDLGLRGHCVGLNGDMYIIRSSNYGGPDDYGGRVDQFGPDGKMKKKNFIDGTGYGDCGVGVDASGNVYVGVNVKPSDKPYPKAFMGKLPAKGWAWWRRRKREVPWHYMYLNPYLFHWGSVFKFGPEGGTFYGQTHRIQKGELRPTAFVKNAPPGAASYRSAYLGREVKMVGAEWRYPGYGVIQSSLDGPTPDPGCVCWTSHLAVDEYGRVFMPNPFIFSVEMLDTAGNQIERIGRYGNADSAGPKSKTPEPEIAFAWPVFASVAGGKLYVSDSVNRRLSVVRFEYAGAAECAVR